MAQVDCGEESLQAQAYRIISRQIVLANYRPGEKLTVNTLADSLGLGRTPVRESLVRLQDAGLVKAVPHSGTYVSKIDLADAESARYVREVMETQAAVEACARATQEDVCRLESLICEAEAKVKDRDRRAFFELDDEFHRAVFLAAGHPRVYGWVRELCMGLDRYRWLRILVEDLDWESILRSHRRILAAIAARNVADAAFLVTEHLHLMLEERACVVERFPQYFTNVPDQG
ncbi:GntR family transcriptional regulator [Granulimonas faecalis]|uniref:GntR family transcriptional regulator n=1 Tax=Granulimonas faecalis TaxID=2894155 RepID=UPI0035142ECA